MRWLNLDWCLVLRRSVLILRFSIRSQSRTMLFAVESALIDKPFDQPMISAKLHWQTLLKIEVPKSYNWDLNIGTLGSSFWKFSDAGSFVILLTASCSLDFAYIWQPGWWNLSFIAGVIVSRYLITTIFALHEIYAGWSKKNVDTTDIWKFIDRLLLIPWYRQNLKFDLLSQIIWRLDDNQNTENFCCDDMSEISQKCRN